MTPELEGKAFIGKKQGGVNTMEVAIFVEVQPVTYDHIFIDYKGAVIKHRGGEFCYKRVKAAPGWKLELTEDDRGKKFNALLVGDKPQSAIYLGVFNDMYIDENLEYPLNKINYYVFKDRGKTHKPLENLYCYKEIEEEELPRDLERNNNNEGAEDPTVGGKRRSRKTRRSRHGKKKSRKVNNKRT